MLEGGMEKTSPTLLKLHGSHNWRVKLGSSPPYSLDTYVHHEDWYRLESDMSINLEAIEDHLEPSTFRVFSFPSG